ncbi:MAG: hypothetical protein WD875_09145 [Pirellulales bacterium]
MAENENPYQSPETASEPPAADGREPRRFGCVHLFLTVRLAEIIYVYVLELLFVPWRMHR